MVVDYLFCIKFLGINLEKICILRQLQEAFVAEKGDMLGTWSATSNVKLNDCAKSSIWSLVAKSASGDASGATVAYTAKVNDQTVDNDCSILTPQFYSLTTK